MKILKAFLKAVLTIVIFLLVSYVLLKLDSKYGYVFEIAICVILILFMLTFIYLVTEGE